jgi:hypothetical protein
MTTMPEAEPNNPREAEEVRTLMEAVWSGETPPDPKYYPYFVPGYKHLFTHIGTEKQLFIDNYVIDWLDGVKRNILIPEKKFLIPWTDLPWEQEAAANICSGAVRDPEDGLYKMWYRQPTNSNQSPRIHRKFQHCHAISYCATLSGTLLLLLRQHKRLQISLRQV